MSDLPVSADLKTICSPFAGVIVHEVPIPIAMFTTTGAG